MPRCASSFGASFLRAYLPLFNVLCLGTAFGATPVIDNERVRVWDVTWSEGTQSPVSGQLDTLSMYIAGGPVRVADEFGALQTVTRKTGDAIYVRQGDLRHEEGAAGSAPARAIVVELKNHYVPPLVNKTGVQLAFPRPHVKKVLENDRVLVWDYTWNHGEPTPMHYHDKDVVVVYTENGSLKSTTPDNQVVVNDYTAGLVRFNTRDRTHTEEVVKGNQHAMMMELK